MRGASVGGTDGVEAGVHDCDVGSDDPSRAPSTGRRRGTTVEEVFLGAAG
jgi:hypothetical protein